MIEIKNLYKRYHNHHGSDWVLRDINLTIPSGVSVGLIGANGAGKSTLLRLIAGMDTPERGEVIRHSRVSWPIGLSGGMQGSMTGRQNVKFVARAQGRATDVNEIVDFVEDFAEIGKAFDEPVKTYSSGMRSRISFGLSFAFEFDVYISDEATAVGDRAFKTKAQELFRHRVGQASLIMVSHSEGILKDLCDAGIYINDGEAVWYDDIEDAISDYHAQSDLLNRPTNAGEVNLSIPAQYKLKSYREQIEEKELSVHGLEKLLNYAHEAKWQAREIEYLHSLRASLTSELRVLYQKLNSTRVEVLAERNKESVALVKCFKYVDTRYSELTSSSTREYSQEEYALIKKTRAGLRELKDKIERKSV